MGERARVAQIILAQNYLRHTRPLTHKKQQPQYPNELTLRNQGKTLTITGEKARKKARPCERAFMYGRKMSLDFAELTRLGIAVAAFCG